MDHYVAPPPLSFADATAAMFPYVVLAVLAWAWNGALAHVADALAHKRHQFWSSGICSVLGRVIQIAENERNRPKTKPVNEGKPDPNKPAEPFVKVSEKEDN